MNRRFLSIMHRMVQVHNNNLSVVFWTPSTRTERQFNCWFSQSNFLVYFAEMSSYFLAKTNKGKVRRRLKCVKEFSHRSNLANGKYLSLFLGVFARIVKISHFSQVLSFQAIEQKKNFTWKIENKKYLHGFSLEN